MTEQTRSLVRYALGLAIAENNLASADLRMFYPHARALQASCDTKASQLRDILDRLNAGQSL